MVFAPVTWKGGTLYILDQTRLPGEYVEVELNGLEAVWDAIKTLKVRGAPAIGICAAFGVLVGVREQAAGDAARVVRAVRESAAHLATSRPTAVNLFWALDRMQAAASSLDTQAPYEMQFARLEAEAQAILREDLALGRRIGEAGAPLIGTGMGVLTHCNAGGLATGGRGTALAVLFEAHERGTRFQVFADETRPLLQGARLTAWELQQAGIDTTLVCDNMAAHLMRSGKVDLVIVGADRVAANGDTANKIGTYGLAVLARAHEIPFYVAIPSSTLDLSLSDGSAIPIEERDAGELTHWRGHQIAPEGIGVYNPAFDVTPASLITGIITEQGVITAPYETGLAACVGQPAIASGTPAN